MTALMLYDLAILYDPNEKMAPSSHASIKYFARIAEKMSVDVEAITKASAGRARRIRRPVHPRDDCARQPHLPLCAPSRERGHGRHRRSGLDDQVHEQDLPDGPARRAICRRRKPRSCTRRSEPSCRSDGPARSSDRAEDSGWIVFARHPQSRNSEEIKRRRRAVPAHDLVLAQEFMLTEFDWRVGVLVGRAALRMPVLHGARPLADLQPSADGTARAGGFETSCAKAPPEMIESRCARPRRSATAFTASISSRPTQGFVVIEVNDNPNLDARHRGRSRQG